jgi:phosphate transport system substrate-binding protein
MTRTYSVAFWCACLAFAAARCGGGQPAGDAAPSVIAVDGSSTVFPISEAVAEEFQRTQPDVRVTVGLSGTGGGFQKFCRGETAISDASRPIRPSEIDACRQAGIEYVELPVAYDGLAVVVHPSNDWAGAMTVSELKKLWEPAAQGTIGRWNQIRADWPDREVHLFGAGVDSGTFEYFTEAIVGEARSSRGDYTSSEDDNVLVQGVAGDASALGYMGLAYYEQNRDRMKLVAVDDGDPSNGEGPIAPSFETVRGGTYRPLSRPLFIYVSTAALQRREVEALVQFYLEADADLVREVGYVPLAETEQQLVRNRFAARRTGTMFAGEMQSDRTLEERLRAAGGPDVDPVEAPGK